MEVSQSYTIIVCDSNKALEQIMELNIYFLNPNYSFPHQYQFFVIFIT